MTKQEAINILGSRADWELQNMKKALSFCGLLNTPEENKRLQACKILLKSQRKNRFQKIPHKRTDVQKINKIIF